MKSKLHPVLLTLLLAILTPAGIATLRAQDASYPAADGYETDADSERERIIYSAGEVDANNRVHVVAGKDSITTRPSQIRPAKQPEAAKNTAKPSSSQEDDILSFNFLYYLFEKYKLQDIVD
ncbi:MAG TPA: hypothetical protein VIU13_09875 [Chryseolinea sp.]